jgi:hypothetical protein
MNKIGRNDPCPCGSGRKYKKCCLQKDLNRRHPQKTYHDYCLELVDSLRSKILTFMERSRHDRYMGEAQDLYWRTLETDLDPPEMDEQGYLRFIEWYIHDFPLPGHGKPVIKLYLETEPQLSQEELQILRDWQGAAISVFQIKDVSPGEGVQVEDIFTDDEVFITDVNLSHKTMKWELLITRMIKVLDEWQASAAGIKESPRAKEDIHRFVMDNFLKFKKVSPDADIRDFLRTKGYLLHQRYLTLLMKPPELPNVLTSTGEEVVFWEARYGLADMGEAMARLEEAYDFELSDSEEDNQGNLLKVIFDWLERGESATLINQSQRKEGTEVDSFFTSGPGRERYRLLGSVTLKPGSLILAATGNKRFKTGKKRLSKVLSGLIRHRLDTVKSLESALRDAKQRPKRHKEDDIPTEIRKALVKETLDGHFREWLDCALRALSGLTPRQASQTRDGRRRLEDLLREMEYLYREGHMKYDIKWIRKELGM